jgi:hypothetical protein
MAATSYPGNVALIVALLIFVGALTGAEAKQVVNPRCEWFGTAPACDGECPAGWTEKKRNNHGDGAQCLSGSKVYCCDFQEYCVPEIAAGWKPGATRTTEEGIIECQECTRWGDDCKRDGPPRFNTVCAHYKWVACGRAPAKPSAGGQDIGLPVQVPDATPAQPTCDPPHEMRNGVCACPVGLTGEFCNYPVLH